MSGRPPSGTGYRAALRHRDLRLLFGGLAISATCAWAYNVALLAYVYDQTQSLTWVGAAGLARFLPALVLSPYAGVIAERFERVRVMVVSDLLSVASQGAMAVVAAMGGSAALVIALGVLTSVSGLVYSPSVSAMIPQVAGEDDLAAANALNSTIDNLVAVTGPAIGAVVLAVSSPSAVFALDAASFAVSAVLIGRMRVRSEPVDVAAEGRGPLALVLVGVRTLLETRAARVPVALCLLASLLYGVDTVLFVGVSDELLGTGPEGFGYLLAGMGVGGIVMAAAVNALSRSGRLAVVITAAVLLYCLPTALLALVETPALAFAVQVVRGGATLVIDVLAIIALQRGVPADRLARVFGAFYSLVLGAIALGTLVTPLVVSAVGLVPTLLVMAFVPAALGLLGYPGLARLDREAQARATPVPH